MNGIAVSIALTYFVIIHIGRLKLFYSRDLDGLRKEKEMHHHGIIMLGIIGVLTTQATHLSSIIIHPNDHLVSTCTVLPFFVKTVLSKSIHIVGECKLATVLAGPVINVCAAWVVIYLKLDSLNGKVSSV